MGSLVWRTVAWFCAGVIVLMVLTVVVASEDGPTPEAAAHYLEQTYPRDPAAATWEVRRIEALPGRIMVVLRVDDGAAAGFLRMPDGARWLAFGPACPTAAHDVWQRLPPEGDIHLRPVSDDGEVIMRRLSCRKWNAHAARG